MLKKLGKFLLGEGKNPLSEEVFHQLSLVAFLAWVGLGADGLSSSAYGPEEAYRALGAGHGHLALYLALATAFTVFIISFSYNQIIELFPHGGGGYTVVSKLMGPFPGLVCGAALVVDYVLTISISIAAGVDAVFSFLPMDWSTHQVKVGVATFFIVMLIWLNMRGLKESIKVLVPIFMVFVLTHLVLIIYGVSVHGSELAGMVHSTAVETSSTVAERGWWGLMVLLVTAYSLGGGTYTGIEAVSNGLNNLREPRVRTGKRTMFYMATSLAFTAGGILICYLLFDIHHDEAKTMNASLIEALFGPWTLGGIKVGPALVVITLASEGLLLFVAAQAGFIDGPNVLSNMAADSWVPHRFANLSVRLVRQNGILLMGAAALGVLWLTKGLVSTLVVLYSINVFITFTLSQLSMAMHWIKAKDRPNWPLRLAINGVGFLLTATILVATTIIKFGQGGWVTLLITGAFILLCWLTHRHYASVKQALKRLDDLLINLPIPEMAPEDRPASPEGPTAVLLVNGYNGLGIHAIFSIRKLFRMQEFKNFIFVSVGQIDSSKFKGSEEMENLRHSITDELDRYVNLAKSMGYYSERRYALGTDRVSELTRICSDLADDFVEPVFFCGKLVFAEENNITRALHNQTALEIQRRLMFAGLNTIVVPVRVL